MKIEIELPEALVAMIKDTNEKVTALYGEAARTGSRRDLETGRVRITDEDLANAPEKIFATDTPPPSAPVASAPAAPVPPPPPAATPAAPVPPPPTPAAPVPPPPPAPVAQPSLPSTDGEVDAKGMPWDSRIHSSSRAKNKEGTWRQRRNLAAGLVEQVEAEHKGAAALPTNAPTFLTLIERVQQLIGAGQITAGDYRMITEKHGFADPSLIATQPDKIPAILEAIEAAACQ